MDLNTAKRLEKRLLQELDAFINPALTIATVLSYAPVCVAEEIVRLSRCIEEESIRTAADGSEVKIPVENELLLVPIDCGLEHTDVNSVLRFKQQLVFEYHGIECCHPPFPFISQYIQRVIERLEEEISKQQTRIESLIHRRAVNPHRPPTAREVVWMPPPYSRFFFENLDRCVKDALYTVLENNPEDAHPDQVLDILRQNPRIPINHVVTSVVRKRFYEATFPFIY